VPQLFLPEGSAKLLKPIGLSDHPPSNIRGDLIYERPIARLNLKYLTDVSQYFVQE
jgi:hypothetical protein